MRADAIAAKAVTHRERATIAIMFATWGAVFLDRMSALYLAPYIAPNLHLCDAQIGWSEVIAAVFWSVAAPVFGALSDRVGRKTALVPMVLLLTVVCGALAILLPLAHPLYRSLWLLAIVLFVTQTGQAIAAMRLVLVPTESVPKHFAATAIGFMNLCGELIGGLAAPLVGGILAQRAELEVPL